MRFAILVLILFVLLTACGDDDAAPPPTLIPTLPPAVQPTQTVQAPIQPTDPPAAPTDTPSPPTPTLEQSQPTTEPTVEPTPEPTIEPTPEPTVPPTPAPVVGGSVSFQDSLAVADQLVLTMNNVAPPPTDSVYEGWLIADDGVTEISTGVFAVEADGSVNYAWTSPSGENLIAQYASFAVTVEPASDSDPGPSNQVVFRGAADADTLAAARRVFAANDGEPVTPRNISYGQGLRAQGQVAQDHVLNAFNAAAIGAFGEMRVHAEHVINIIEGTTGPRFADYNGDGRAENPGDGFGTLAYARQMAVLLPAASTDLAAVESLLVTIQDKAQEISAAPDLATAQPLLNDFKALSEQLMNQAVPTAYAAAQATVTYSLVPNP